MSPHQHGRAGFDGYEAWREKRLAERLVEPVAESGTAPWNHLISVLLYAEEPTDAAEFRASIESLKGQTYRNLEIIILGPQPEDKPAEIDCAGLRGLFLQPYLSPTEFLAEPRSETLWRGDYAIFAPAGIEFDPDALALLNAALSRQPERAEIITCDYDMRSGRDGRREPHFLPGWDPDYIQSVDYLRTAFLASRELIGRQRSQGCPASLHDWLRRFGRMHPQPATCHVAECLLHLPESRLTPTRLPASPDLPSTFPSVAILVPNRNRPDLVARCLDFLDRGLPFRPEVIVIDNASDDPGLPAVYADLRARHGAQILSMDQPFNFARMINLGAAATAAEVVLLLNNDVHFSQAGEMEKLIAAAMRPEVGVAGCLLQYPDGTVQHAGVLLRLHEEQPVPIAGADHVLRGAPLASLPEIGGFNAVRNWQAVTGAVLAIRREVFERLGGFDEVALPVDYNDIDFCLRARAAGLRVLALPLMGVVHAESSTRGQTPREIAAQVWRAAAAIMAARWPSEFSHDPYRNPWCEFGERPSPVFPWSPGWHSPPKATKRAVATRPPPRRQDPTASFLRRHVKRVVYGLLRKGDLGRRLHTRLGHMLDSEVPAPQSPRVVADTEHRRPKQRPHRLQLGLSISGYLCSEIGLGQAARNIAYACDRQGLAVSLRAVPLAGRGNDSEFASKCNPVADRMVNLVVAGLPSLDASPAEPGRVNILLPFWELSRIPERWAEQARRFDEVWAPSQFIADAFAADFRRPVRLMRQPVRLPPEDAAADPTAHPAIGRARDALRLLTYLDFDSWTSRKNPAAAVGAFRAAFPPQQRDVELVVKMRGHDDRGARRFLDEASSQDRRIRLIDSTLDRAAMDRLIGSCDAFLSLHRSEGFGFGAAEALAAGRAAVATDYGGTTDFITSDTGYPVAYRLQSVQPGQYVDTEGQVWAEPLLDSAVAALRAIYDDPDEAAVRARRGQAFLRKHHGVAAAGSRIEELLGQRNLP